MTHITGHDRSQTLLLPESLDDYVGPENPARFIGGFRDSLDLAAAGFARVQLKQSGRPGYAPGDLLKLYVYGYLNRIRSSRRLEAETHRNIDQHKIRACLPLISYHIRHGMRQSFLAIIRSSVPNACANTSH